MEFSGTTGAKTAPRRGRREFDRSDVSALSRHQMRCRRPQYLVGEFRLVDRAGEDKRTDHFRERRNRTLPLFGLRPSRRNIGQDGDKPFEALGEDASHRLALTRGLTPERGEKTARTRRREPLLRKIVLHESRESVVAGAIRDLPPPLEGPFDRAVARLLGEVILRFEMAVEASLCQPGFLMAERIFREAHRFDPTGVSRPCCCVQRTTSPPSAQFLSKILQ